MKSSEKKKIHTLLFAVLILLSFIQSCCGRRALAVIAHLQFEGYEIFTPVYVIKTPASDINAHLDTTVHILQKNNKGEYLLSINFGTGPDEYEAVNYIIYPDTFDVSHTITDIEVKYKTSCRDEPKSYTFKFDGEEKTGSANPIVIKK